MTDRIHLGREPDDHNSVRDPEYYLTYLLAVKLTIINIVFMWLY